MCGDYEVKEEVKDSRPQPGAKVKVVFKNDEEVAKYGAHHLEIGQIYTVKELYHDGIGVSVYWPQGVYMKHQILELNEYIVVGSEAEAEPSTSPSLPKEGNTVRVITEFNVDTPERDRGAKFGLITWHGYQVGDEVEVLIVRADGSIYASRLSDGLHQNIYRNDYELISEEAESEPAPKAEPLKFAIGDRVESPVGLGTVVFITKWSLSGDSLYLVKHDNWFGGHNGHNGNLVYNEGAPTLQDDSGWYYFADGLEAVLSKASGEEIRPAVSIGDKVRVLTNGAMSEGNEETLVGYHEYEEGEIVEVVDFGFRYASDSAIDAIVVKRPEARNEYNTQTLYRDDYEKVEAEKQDLAEILLPPKQAAALMLSLVTASEVAEVRQADSKKFITTMHFLLDDFERYQETGELNADFTEYLKQAS